MTLPNASGSSIWTLACESRDLGGAMWIYPAAFLASAAAMAACNAIELRPWRKAPDEHWTIRARLLFPARLARNFSLWMIPLAVTVGSRFPAPGSSFSGVLVAAFLGAVLGNYPTDRALAPGLTFREWLHEAFDGLVWKIAFFGPYAVAGLLMPAEAGLRMGMLVAFVLAAHFFLVLGGGIWLGRKLGHHLPASPRLQALVDEVSGRMGVAVRGTWLFPSREANAYAHPFSRQLVFSTRLVAVCLDAEIKAVAAHEIGHLAESRGTRRARLLGSLILFPYVFAKPAWELWGGFGLLAPMAASFLIATGQARLSRAMENRADRIACEQAEDPKVYARALECIYLANQAPVVLRKDPDQSHPDLYDRMLAAGVTPEYPRPRPPQGMGWTAWAAIAALVIAAGAWVGRDPFDGADAGIARPPDVAVWPPSRLAAEALVVDALERLRSDSPDVRANAALTLRTMVERYPEGEAILAKANGGAPAPVNVPVPENFTGVWTTYFTNGRKAKEDGRRDGRRVGILRAYVETGRVVQEGTYDDEGRLDGVQRSWYRDGALEYEVHYANGLLHGTERYWGATGELETERFHEMGQRVDP